MSKVVSPFAHPLYVMAKPAGAQCNLECRYCYYLEKNGLYPPEKSSPNPHAGGMLMSQSLLETFVRQYIEAQTQREVLFTWHGGEAMLRPLSFYQEAVRLQQKYAAGHLIDNCLQTNGTLITEEWCEFLRQHHWLVGVSVDGPQEIHDAFRKDRRGNGSFRRVMDGIALLDRYGVEWNAMAVVNSRNAEQPLDFYHFFKDIGCHYIQFTPIVERMLPRLVAPLEGLTQDDALVMTPESVSPRQWGSFLCAIFNEWVANDVGDYYVQLFDATLANWLGVEPGVCSMAKTCGNAMAMEYNGDVYSCDHFVFPAYRLGNICEQPLATLGYGEQQNRFRQLKTALPAQCRQCRFDFACHGECPKNRLLHTVDGETGLNYLCEGYRQFFTHAAPYMDFMAREWRADRAPANVMTAVRQGLL
jgi:uncharacterized protein